MSSKPSSSSSSAKPSSSSSAPKPSSSSSSSSSRPSGSSSSSSSSSSKPSSSSSSSAPPGPPPQPTPYISANAWMSFFLFCCLVLIILQGPLGLTNSPSILPTLPGFGGTPVWGGGIGCGGMVAAHVPSCAPPMIAPVVSTPPAAVEMIPPPAQQPTYSQPQMGGQGQIATSGGGAGWSWYVNQYPPYPPPSHRGYYHPAPRPHYRSVQYQRPGLQVSVNSGSVPYAYAAAPSPHRDYYQEQYHAASPAPVAQTPPVIAPAAIVPPTSTQGLQTLESAFYPLLVGAIALLIIFDYAS